MKSEGKVVMMNLQFLGRLVNILWQEYLPDELVGVPLVPESSSMQLSHHPVQLLLQLKIFTKSK